MKKLGTLFASLAVGALAGFAGLVVGIILWFAAVEIFGYPGDTPHGTRISSSARLEQMNYAQYLLEFYGGQIIPLICAAIAICLAFRKQEPLK